MAIRLNQEGALVSDDPGPRSGGVYRRPAEKTLEPQAPGYVTLRKYLDPIEGQLDRDRLDDAGIDARLVEPSTNPLFTGTTGGVHVLVDSADVARAAAILREHAPSPVVDDEPDQDAKVRCPRCELEYCTHRRPYLRSLGAVATGLSLVGLPLLIFGEKRWHCERCEYVWDDATSGPAQLTRLRPGDARPVFRLRRAHPGMGMLVGLVAGFFASMATSRAFRDGRGAVLFVATTVLGWLVGRAVGGDVCSDPKCRTPLPRSAETCPGCRNGVAGRVRSAAEHYAAAAEFRRDLAALRAKDAKRAKRKARKPDGTRAT
jgi:hypothetical protein